jgi:NADH-quinone oxidoreductase subunit L
MDALPLIVLLPAFGALLTGVVGIRYFPQRTTALVACGAMLGSFVLSVWAFAQLLALPPEAREHTVVVADWITPMALRTAGGPAAFTASWALRLDPLSAMMILVVTGIGFLIHVYATGYMAEEKDGAYARFFCYLNLFVFFMLTLVLGANFLVLFVGWEGVGLCSYLLIGYWYDRRSAADAGKKAFLVNRIGDFGFLLGMFLVFDTFGTLDFRAVANAAATWPVETAAFGTLSAICLLLFVGATGKSAQIPLYVWLPDAMEGPTPVSALIHAATMVTAGVYMVCRNAVLFEHAPMVMQIVAVIGALTALVAATIGLVQTDIKRVLAYSTVSQLGYMFLATGVGAFAAGAFHLMTHAFFKALLFLGSGSVIHGMAGEQDMQRMGNLRKMLPVTFATMMVGTLAIAGIPPLSGFFSKDEILYRTFLENPVLWALAAVTALMTAFYMFRLMAMTFYGSYRGPAYEGAHAGGAAGGHAGHHDAHGGHGAGAHGGHDAHGGNDAHGHGHAWHGPHESPAVMTVPLIVLAAGAVLAGFVGIPAALGGGNAIEHFLEPSFAAHAPATGTVPAAEAAVAAQVAQVAPPGAGEAPPAAEEEHHTAVELGLMALSIGLAALGIGFAWRAYVLRPAIAEALATRYAGLHRVLYNKYYVDEAYDSSFVRGTMGAARTGWWFDRWVVDGAVNFSGWMTRATAWLSGLADKHGVDGVVNATGNTLWEASFGYRRLQTGLIQNYALLMMVGVVALVTLYMFLR